MKKFETHLINLMIASVCIMALLCLYSIYALGGEG